MDSSSQQPPPGTSSDRAAVALANTQFYQAFEALDFGAMTRVWSEHSTISCVHPGWTLVSGRSRVLASWEGILRGTERIRFVLREPEVFVHGATAWVVLIEEIEAEQAGTIVRAFAHTTNLFQLEEGAWKLVHHHAAPMPPPDDRMAANANRRTLH